MADEVLIKEEKSKKEGINSIIESVGVESIVLFIIAIFILGYTYKYISQGEAVKQIGWVIVGALVIYLLTNYRKEAGGIMSPEVAKALSKEYINRMMLNGEIIGALGKKLSTCNISPIYSEGTVQYVDGLPKQYMFGVDIDNYHFALLVSLNKITYGHVYLKYYPQRVFGGEDAEIKHVEGGMIRNFRKYGDFIKYTGGGGMK